MSEVFCFDHLDPQDLHQDIDDAIFEELGVRYHTYDKRTLHLLFEDRDLPTLI